MYRLGLLLFFVSLISCKSNQESNQQDIAFSEAQREKAKEIIKKDNVTLHVYDFDGFEPFLHQDDQKVYIVNFWATWCKPCIEELPDFERIHKEFESEKVKVLLVSLDMPKMYETHLIPFINKNNLSSDIVILDDPRMNDWIPKVDEEWGGAIPATLIYNKDTRTFYEKSMSYEELKQKITQLIN